MKDTQMITRKIKLCPLGDKEEVNRVYKFIRDGQYAQNRAYNILISHIYTAIISGKSSDEINEIYKRGQRKPKKDNSEWSLYEYGEFEFPIGMQTASSVKMRVSADIKKSKTDGLFKGKVSLPNKKLDAPLIIESQQFSFCYNYDTYNDFLENISSENLDICMKFVNGINFKVVLGNPHKSAELRAVFKNIFEEIYKVCGSSIQIDGKSIILNLSLQIPIKEIELDENIIVGVDLGIAIPAVCALNNNTYIKKSIGCADDFIRVRTKIQAQKRRLQKSLQYTSGGHGRKKKMKPLDRFEDYERNWVKTYNHMVSKNVVQFAINNHAKYINLEDLSGYDANDFILRNWSYYELQQQITYKANMYGIEVRYINPYHTSQICSCCGHWEEGQRDSQSHFKCKSCGTELNADFNAARNIAMSKDFK